MNTQSLLWYLLRKGVKLRHWCLSRWSEIVVIDQKSKILYWRGYTIKKRYSQERFSEGYAQPAAYFEQIPYCIESYSYLRNVDPAQRTAMQSKYFERCDQSVMGNIYLGLVQKQEAARTREQLKLVISTLMRLMQLMSRENLNGPEFQKIFNSISPAAAAHLKNSLASSVHFYANDCAADLFKNVQEQPLYIELGTDILANGTDLLLSEFQVRFATPYAHLLTDMCEAYAELLPELWKRFDLKIDRFEAERNKLLRRAMEKFASMRDDKPIPMLLDAWAYMQNTGANWIEMARDFQMNYLLFDDLIKGRNFYETAYQNGRLSFFNQAALSLVDPSHRAFKRVNSERIEWYDELEWKDLTDRYLQGDIFFAHPPLTDIANDKAFYPALAELCKYFFAEDLKLPIMQCGRCWSDDDYTKPNFDLIASMRANKASYVLAHRYLEGGMGIKVGKLIDQKAWEDFIDTYVVPRPYLFVAREYFHMDVDFAFRILTTGYQDRVDDVSNKPELFVSDTFYARFTTTSPIMSDNHRTVLTFEPGTNAPVPRYDLKDELR